MSSIGKERRQSFVGNAGAPVIFPQAAPSTTYPTHPSVASQYPFAYHGYASSGSHASSGGHANSGGHGRSVSVGTHDITKHMHDLDINKGERERKVSFGRPHHYSTKESPYERPRTISGNFSDRSGSVNPKSHYSSSSPNVRPGEFPSTYGKAGSTGYPVSNTSSPDIGRSTTPFGHLPGGYPPNNVLYDPNQHKRIPSRPISRAASRAPSPNHG